MAEDKFTAEESRKLAVLFARAWSDASLAADYAENPKAVLAGAGVHIGSRAAPEIPARPAEIEGQAMVMSASGSSASSISCATCPCSGCTASCACCALKDDLGSHVEAILKLAEDPAGRAQAREMMARWNVNFGMKG